VLVSVESSRAGAFVWLVANQYSIFYKRMGLYKARKNFQPLILKGCKVVFDATRQLLTPPKEPKKNKIGFGVEENQLRDLSEKKQHQRLRKRGFTQKLLSERKIK
jgi:hypothetical protein